MRPTTKVLLTACATFALAHGVALADPPNPNPASDPNANPTPPVPPDPNATPATPPTNNNPPVTPDSTTPAPVEPAPIATPDTPPPATTPVVVDTHSDDDYDARYSYAWSDDLMRSRIGVSAIIGGGVAGFTDRTMRETTSSVGGLWDFRLTLGSHVPLGLELGYTGTATNLKGLPAQNGTLIGTTAEAALRYNVLPHFMWTPYVFGGVGWQRYDVTNANVTLSDSGMNDHDNLLEFPMGAGLAYRASGFVLDLRGTFRAATDQNLVLKAAVPPTTIAPSSNDFAPMHTWEASAALGYEF
jgi:hypothetical protein